MTREEAIEVIKGEKKSLQENPVLIVNSVLYEAFDMAIKALEQEPSRDMEEISEVLKCDADAETKCKMISNILNAKPHYFEKQEPKTGHWIMTGDYLTTAYSSIDYVKCSCCNEYSLEEGDYCPNCGACMKDCRTLDEFIEDSKESEE